MEDAYRHSSYAPSRDTEGLNAPGRRAHFLSRLSSGPLVQGNVMDVLPLEGFQDVPELVTLKLDLIDDLSHLREVYPEALPHLTSLDLARVPKPPRPNCLGVS